MCANARPPAAEAYTVAPSRAASRVACAAQAGSWSTTASTSLRRAVRPRLRLASKGASRPSHSRSTRARSSSTVPLLGSSTSAAVRRWASLACAAIRARADKRLAALGDIFPEGSWERDDPIMLESRQMRLLFKQYHSLPDGRVNLVPCTLVILPDRNRAATDREHGTHFGSTERFFHQLWLQQTL